MIGAGVLLAAVAMAYVPARVMGVSKQREALWQSPWSRLRASPASHRASRSQPGVRVDAGTVIDVSTYTVPAHTVTR